MKKILHSIILFSTLSLGNSVIYAQNTTLPSATLEKDELAHDYIAQFKHFAIQEMQKTGIPASITLAQGLHESDYGRSRLAKLANNHFGAKAHNTWVGPTITHTDDAPDEHFRKYNSVEHSYRDHSKVLAKERYAFLYRLNPYDYKAWSHGLKKAGYATDPNYAYKLIKIIENYSLYIYDNPNYNEPQKEVQDTYISASYTKPTTPTKTAALQPSDAGYMSASYTKPVTSTEIASTDDVSSTYKKSTKSKKKKVTRIKETYIPIQTKEQAQVTYSSNPKESVDLAMRAEMSFEKPKPEWYNGSRVVYLDNHIMPSQIAFWLEIDLDKLLKWNYTHAHIPFEKGKPIYLEALRTKGGAMADRTYTALREQTLVDVALASGIRLERLMKLNKMDNPLDYISPGETIQLRRKARKAPKTIAKHHFEILAQMPIRSAYLNTEEINQKQNFTQRIATEMPKSFYAKRYEEPKPNIVQTTPAYNTNAVTYSRTNNTVYTQNTVSNYAVESNYNSVNNSYSENNANKHTNNFIVEKNDKAALNSPVYHTVEKGQTLYRLSVIYKVSVDSIKQLNNLTNNTIKIGSSVRVK